VLLDETPGSIASEVWSLGATVYSLLAGRSPFEVPGGSNSSTDLMSRIARAKPQPIGRADVPASLENLLKRAMSRKPELRPASALDFVRELQVIETELGVSQTPIEVSMDEWASATVQDMEDRTRLRPLPSSAATPSPRRRRRAIAAAASAYQPVGTVREASGPNRFSASRPGPMSRRQQTIAWVLVAAAVLVVALGATALVVLLRAANSTGIPTVTDISATETNGTVEFTWPDPGLDDGDRYQIQVRDGTSSNQRSPLFRVDAQPGDTVCITVTVNRQGKVGDPSTEKCIDVEG
jgi:serine/threonine protein kinase